MKKILHFSLGLLSVTALTAPSFAGRGDYVAQAQAQPLVPAVPAPDAASADTDNAASTDASQDDNNSSGGGSTGLGTVLGAGIAGGAALAIYKLGLSKTTKVAIKKDIKEKASAVKAKITRSKAEQPTTQAETPAHPKTQAETAHTNPTHVETQHPAAGETHAIAPTHVETQHPAAGETHAIAPTHPTKQAERTRETTRSVSFHER